MEHLIWIGNPRDIAVASGFHLDGWRKWVNFEENTEFSYVTLGLVVYTGITLYLYLLLLWALVNNRNREPFNSSFFRLVAIVAVFDVVSFAFALKKIPVIPDSQLSLLEVSRVEYWTRSFYVEGKMRHCICILRKRVTVVRWNISTSQLLGP